MGWGRTVAALFVVALALPVPPAGAHEGGDPYLVTRIDAIEPALPGVTIQVRAGDADQMFVANTTPTPLTVVATGGEPFLRIGPNEVEANVASPDWYLSNSPRGTATVPVTARAGAAPRWRVVGRTGSWAWYDHRLHDVDRPVEELFAGGTPRRLAEWAIPVHHGAARGTIRGHVEFRVPNGRFRTRLEEVPEGVSVDLLDGPVPGVFLRYGGRAALLVRGIEGEPFARLTATSAEVNDASPTWQEDQRLRGEALPAVPADPAGAPRWRRVSDRGLLVWYDRRLQYSPGYVPADVAGADGPTTMVEWELPLEIGGKTERLRGTRTWHPDPRHRDGPSTVVLAAIGAGTAVVVIGGMLLLREVVTRRAAAT